MLYMVTFTINIPPMLAYIPTPWILWDIAACTQADCRQQGASPLRSVPS